MMCIIFMAVAAEVTRCDPDKAVKVKVTCG